MQPVPAAGTGGTNPAACEPTTCAALGRTCGSAPDGCGGQLACGTCKSPAFCGQDGTCVQDVECLEGAAAIRQGDVRVPGFATLDALIGILRIEGTLAIDRVQQGDLAQLACLEEVTGDLRIGPDPGVSSLRGLDSLTVVGGSLEISGGEMIDLAGLDRLQSVGGHVLLSGMADLMNLQALAQLREVSALHLVDLPALTSLAGLEGVSRLPGWLPMSLASPEFALTIMGCGGLPDLTGLDGLQHLGTLRLQDNASLVSLAGLEGVRTVGCDGATFDCDASEMPFELRDNPQLADVSAFGSSRCHR